MNTTKMPINAGCPTSLYSKMATKSVSNGAVNMKLRNVETISKRFASFDRRLTIRPGAVSPSAVCDNRKAYFI